MARAFNARALGALRGAIIPATDDEFAGLSDERQLHSVPNRDGGRTVDGGGIPLVQWRESQSLDVAPAGRVLQSEVAGVVHERWTAFALAMKVQEVDAVSASNELGMFGLKVRRLADLGLVTNLRYQRSATKRMIWIGDWVAPLTERSFLSSPKAQYKAFAASVRRFVAELEDGTIARPAAGMPEGLTLSGVLALLHRCGPKGLETWESKEKWPSTVAIVGRVNGIF